MPEGVRPYPRWDGPLANSPPFGAIIMQELRRSLRSMWMLVGIVIIGSYTLLSIGQLYEASQPRETAEHTIEDFVVFLSRPTANFLVVDIEATFAPLMLAAIMAGPALLLDSQKGALELYLSRSLSIGSYLVSKFLAVFTVSTLALFGPAMIYYVLAFFFFTKHPEGWALVPLQALGYSMMWGLLVTSLGLGLSAASRSSRAAVLILFGAIIGLHAVASNLLEAITRDPTWQIISPISALQQITEILFDVPGPFEFPTWWAVAEWAGLVVLGAFLIWWRHPKVRGADRGGA